jgi:hypothetical protein
VPLPADLAGLLEAVEEKMDDYIAGVVDILTLSHNLSESQAAELSDRIYWTLNIVAKHC